MNTVLPSPKYTETNFIWEKNYSFSEIIIRSAQFTLEKSPRRWLLLQSHFKPTISQVHANNLMQASHTQLPGVISGTKVFISSGSKSDRYYPST